MSKKTGRIASLAAVAPLFLAALLCSAASVKPLAEPDPAPVVGIGRGSDYAKTTEAAIAASGGLAGVVKKGDVVLIKPNLCTNSAPDKPNTTDYRVVKRIAELAREAGAARIVVAEGGFYGNCFSKTQAAINKYDSIAGVVLFDFNSCEKKDCYELTAPNSLIGRSLFIPKIYVDADVVITAAKMKTHFLSDAVVSLALKNVFGVPSEKIYGGYGDKSGLHNFPLAATIVDLNKIRKPDFSVIDGIVGGEGYGPVNNTPVKSEIVIAGKDPVAVDTVGLTFMGFAVDQVPHVMLAAKEKLGIADLSKITVKGADLSAIKMNFQSTFKRSR
jgi:uncharacterized protein (DUF362 family)